MTVVHFFPDMYLHINGGSSHFHLSILCCTYASEFDPSQVKGRTRMIAI